MGKATGKKGGQGLPITNTGQVVPLPGQPPSVEPPDGWQVNSSHGHQRCNATPAGRLVRLADVVRWLMDSPKELPRKAAIEAVCSALNPEAYGCLYWLQPDAYAKPVPPDSMWGFKTDAQRQKEAEQSQRNAGPKRWQNERECESWHLHVKPEWLARDAPSGSCPAAASTPAQPYTAPAPGLPALIALIHANWGPTPSKPAFEPLTKPGDALARLAIPIDRAHAAWDYGGVATHQATPVQSTGSVTKWTHEALAQLLADSQTKKNAELAREHGVSPSRITALLKKVKGLTDAAENQRGGRAQKTKATNGIGSIVRQVGGGSVGRRR